MSVDVLPSLGRSVSKGIGPDAHYLAILVVQLADLLVELAGSRPSNIRQVRDGCKLRPGVPR